MKTQPSLFPDLDEPGSSPPPHTIRARASVTPAGTGKLRLSKPSHLAESLKSFDLFGKSTVQLETQAEFRGERVPAATFVNEYWTSVQRAASSLHEISYRACFKPQLPRFFIERLTDPGDRVYDPFMGRGTTPIEAALLGRIPVGCDINPLSVHLVKPRLHPPTLEQVEKRLEQIDLNYQGAVWEELLAFYHPETLRGITAIREYLLKRQKQGTRDFVDDWIDMVCLNRLTGHSVGFFSVYSLPPNQATSIKGQLRINEKRNQTPPARDLKKIILKKTRLLLSDCTPEIRKVLQKVADSAQLITASSAATPQIPDASIDLVVTSPPFLNVVQYASDNWLRCWFIGIDASALAITFTSKLSAWRGAMTNVFQELKRTLRPSGRIAFEVGEVNGGALKLEEEVIPAALEAGLVTELVLINDQEFTKTANCWGVDNNGKGTNTNRVVVLRQK